jgi:hypothetical protein
MHLLEEPRRSNGVVQPVFKASQDQYDRLGHIIDWMRTIAKRADNQFLILDETDREITRMTLEKRARQPRRVHDFVSGLYRPV